MKKAAVLLFALILSAFFGTSSAFANSACFDWSCTSPLAQCDFDGGCSTGFVWKYSWDFGDGTTLNFSSNATPSHDYAEAPPSTGEYIDVSLEVAIFSVGDFSVTCSCGIRDIIGPPNPISGRCQ